MYFDRMITVISFHIALGGRPGISFLAKFYLIILKFLKILHNLRSFVTLGLDDGIERKAISPLVPPYVE